MLFSKNTCKTLAKGLTHQSINTCKYMCFAHVFLHVLLQVSSSKLYDEFSQTI